MTTPKVVVFDIGNVILNWDPDLLYSKLIPDPAARQTFFADTNIHEMNLDVDRGAPFRDTIYAHADRYPDHGDLIRAWHDRWPEMLTPEISGTSNILRRLKSNSIPVFALSNFGADSYTLARKIYPILLEFDREYISGRMKLIKPDPGIYEELERDSGFHGADLCFFDDSAKNIDAAKSRGWQAHIFENPAKMQSDLENMGLLNHN